MKSTLNSVYGEIKSPVDVQRWHRFDLWMLEQVLGQKGHVYLRLIFIQMCSFILISTCCNATTETFMANAILIKEMVYTALLLKYSLCQR